MARSHVGALPHLISTRISFTTGYQQLQRFTFLREVKSGKRMSKTTMLTINHPETMKMWKTKILWQTTMTVVKVLTTQMMTAMTRKIQKIQILFHEHPWVCWTVKTSTGLNHLRRRT